LQIELQVVQSSLRYDLTTTGGHVFESYKDFEMGGYPLQPGVLDICDGSPSIVKFGKARWPDGQG
jgi:hypothetical protein